jgi:hypothetical protein
MLFTTSVAVFQSSVNEAKANPSTVFSDGFESGDFSAWTGTNGSPTVVTSPVHHGTRAMQADTSSVEQAYKTLPGYSTLYERCYVYFTNLPTNGNLISILELLSLSGSQVDVVLGVKNWSGTLKWGLTWCNAVTDETIYFATTPNPTTGVWYCIELKVTCSATAYDWQFWVDGTSLKTGTRGITPGTIDTARVGAWDKSEAITNYVDCVVVADTYIEP